MIGEPGLDGVVQLLGNHLFAFKKKAQGKFTYFFKVACAEIYQESVVDLLFDHRGFFEDVDSEEIVMPQAWHVVSEPEVMQKCITAAIDRRKETRGRSRAHVIWNFSILRMKNSDPDDLKTTTIQLLELSGFHVEPHEKLGVSQVPCTSLVSVHVCGRS